MATVGMTAEQFDDEKSGMIPGKVFLAMYAT
jgi:hypothetical protein